MFLHSHLLNLKRWSEMNSAGKTGVDVVREISSRL